MNEVHHDRAVYVGQSQILRYLPTVLLATALLPLLLGAPYAALALAAPGVAAGLIFPWRFAVADSGIGLWFGLGKYRFLDKASVTIRFRYGSPVLSHRSRQRLGYPLTDPNLQDGSAPFRAILSDHAFHISD
jgi:hypothetical protein